jgi:alcohol dehydrogenase
VLVAKALGHPVVGVDALDSKLDDARELGADEVLTPAQVTASKTRAPVVIEAAGHPRAFETALAATAPGGRTVTVGLPAPQARAEISPLVLTAEARTVIGSYLGSSVPARDIPVYVDLWRQGRLPIERLVSRVVPLAAINEAMDTLAEGRVIRQLLAFD